MKNIPSENPPVQTTRLFSSLSVRLQGVAIFLSFVGVAYGVKSYLHIRANFGEEAAAPFYNDLMLQIAFALLLNGIVAWVLYLITTKPIKTLGQVMRELTQGDFDVEVPYTNQPTEIGSMARKVQIFKESGIEKRALEKQQKINEQKAEAEKKQAMYDLADRFESQVRTIIKEVSAEVTSVKSLAEQMSRMVQGATNKAAAVSQTAGETSQNVNSVAGAAEEMSASINEMAQQIFKSNESVKAAVGAQESANKTATMLESAAKKIGEIVSLIQAIAEQINLLALNATIESARAGEAGRGFAVVAGEVKSLALQTSRATDDIASQIVNIQEVSKQVMAALATINASISEVAEFSTSISAAINQQSAATNEIAQNIGGAASHTEQISLDIQEVQGSTGEASHSADDAVKAVNVLAHHAERLNQAMDAFLRDIRAA